MVLIEYTTVAESLLIVHFVMQAGQDLRFFSLSTCGCFCLSALVLLVKSIYRSSGIYKEILLEQLCCNNTN